MLQRLKLPRHFKALGAAVQGLLTPENWEGNVAMFHEGRCGSSVLAGLLDQHSAIHWDGEIYGKHNPGGPINRHLRYNYPLLYLRQRIARLEKDIYGFETKAYLHLRKQIGISLEEYLKRLEDIGFSRYIILDRKNDLRRAVSTTVASKRKKWALSKQEKSQLVRVELDPEGVLSWSRRLNEINNKLGKLLNGKPVLRLTYEEHIESDPRTGYRKVCKFLGLPLEKANVELKKVNPFPLSEMIENYDEVCRVFSGTDAEWMLEE